MVSRKRGRDSAEEEAYAYIFMDCVNLPEEMVILILERLPPASIRQFRSVCKSWCRILSGPGFLKRSILLQCTRRRTCLAITEQKGDKPAGFIDPSSCSPTELPLLPQLPEDGGHLLVVGSYQGIVCLADRDKSKWCALWNPTTGELSVVPEHDHYPLADGGRKLACRFGFGQHDGNWKVVKIVEDWDQHYVRYWAWIYELGSDTWKKISPIGIHSWSRFSRGNSSSRTGTCWRDGRMYSWMGFDSIAFFDMATEAFSTNLHPNFRVPPGSSLLTLNNLLAFFCPRSCYKLSEFSDIWVLLQHDERNSWTKLWSIQHQPEMYWALEVWNGGLVWNMWGEDRLQWYDLSNSQVKTLPVAYKSRSSEVVVAFEKTHASLANLRKPKELKRLRTDEPLHPMVFIFCLCWVATLTLPCLSLYFLTLNMRAQGTTTSPSLKDRTTFLSMLKFRCGEL